LFVWSAPEPAAHFQTVRQRGSSTHDIPFKADHNTFLAEVYYLLASFVASRPIAALSSASPRPLAGLAEFPINGMIANRLVAVASLLREKSDDVSLAGATALRGITGFGAHSRLHTFKIERLSLDLPIVVEIVDTAPKLEAFLHDIDPLIRDGLATVEKADVRFYRSRADRSAGAA
jgi:PII-like signaling protein